MTNRAARLGRRIGPALALALAVVAEPAAGQDEGAERNAVGDLVRTPFIHGMLYEPATAYAGDDLDAVRRCSPTSTRRCSGPTPPGSSA